MINVLAATPEWTLIAFAVAVVLLDLFISDKRLLAGLSIAGLVISAVVSVLMVPGMPIGNNASAFNGMLSADGFSIYFNLLFIGIAILIILASQGYVNKFKSFESEYYALILIATIGMMLMAATTELISIYLSLELTGIALYVLVGYLKDNKSSESSLKYLLLGAVASAILLYGMAFVYGSTGTTRLTDIAGALSSLPNMAANPALLLGVVLIVAGFGFKMAAVPFQMWVPDVYEGAPTPVTAFLSVGSKAAGFAVVLRIFSTAFIVPGWLSVDWGMIFAALSVISMFAGNIIAIPQTNIKRMLGYSSVAQAGYLMVGLATAGAAFTGDTLGQSGIIFFLASYAVTNLAVFIAIIAITDKINSDNIADFAGLGKRSPALALALTLGLVSLIGIPPAAGFMAKFYIFNGAVQHGMLWLVIIAVINSVISAYYYLRVVKVMWLDQPSSEETVPSSGALRVSLVLSTLGVLVLGIAPGLLLGLAGSAARVLGF